MGSDDLHGQAVLALLELVLTEVQRLTVGRVD